MLGNLLHLLGVGVLLLLLTLLTAGLRLDLRVGAAAAAATCPVTTGRVIPAAAGVEEAYSVTVDDCRSQQESLLLQ